MEVEVAVAGGQPNNQAAAVKAGMNKSHNQQ